VHPLLILILKLSIDDVSGGVVIILASGNFEQGVIRLVEITEIKN
jgi:hypothetical protein